MAGIHIKPSHKGLFTKKAHAAGKSVGEFATEEADAGGKLGKEANFARMARRGFKPLPPSQKKSSRRRSLAKNLY